MVLMVTFLSMVTLVINVITDIIIGLVTKVSNALTVTNITNFPQYREHFHYTNTLHQFTVQHILLATHIQSTRKNLVICAT